MLPDWLYPKRCVGCGSWGNYLCRACQAQLEVSREAVCPVCGRLAVGGKTHPGCRKGWRLDGMVGIWAYQGVTREMVKTLKYRFVSDLTGEVIALAKKVLEEEARRKYLEFWRFMGKEPVVIPVPLHRDRWRWRGFNQAAVLGRELARVWQLPFSVKILIRKKPTRPQVELKGKARTKNIQGAFALIPLLKSRRKPLGGKDFLLIDDVWTTGSTMRECCRVLKRGGAREIWGLTLAR